MSTVCEWQAGRSSYFRTSRSNTSRPPSPQTSRWTDGATWHRSAPPHSGTQAGGFKKRKARMRRSGGTGQSSSSSSGGTSSGDDGSSWSSAPSGPGAAHASAPCLPSSRRSPSSCHSTASSALQLHFPNFHALSRAGNCCMRQTAAASPAAPSSSSLVSQTRAQRACPPRAAETWRGRAPSTADSAPLRRRCTSPWTFTSVPQSTASSITAKPPSWSSRRSWRAAAPCVPMRLCAASAA
mmetsp:Transcript_18116/g.51366  ORF Transcript_18116/g.51366 Transcript_18116/m.51366 type:complete len:239 (-) Transcript_18116:132-848(-)